jgi:hypothetical protein
MSQHTVDMSGQRYAVQVYQYPDHLWIADGEFLGRQLRTIGSTMRKAVMAWQNAAVKKLRLAPSVFLG